MSYEEKSYKESLIEACNYFAKTWNEQYLEKPLEYIQYNGKGKPCTRTKTYPTKQVGGKI